MISKKQLEKQLNIEVEEYTKVNDSLEQIKNEITEKETELLVRIGKISVIEEMLENLGEPEKEFYGNSRPNTEKDDTSRSK